MPKVGGKEYPYTPKGVESARKAANKIAKKTGNKINKGSKIPTTQKTTKRGR